jgi:ketosteroid isomerase-like protein
VRTKNLAATGIAKKFVDAINAHDVDALTKLMSSDHVLVDSLGSKFPASAIRSGWQQYFTIVPDYSVEVDQIASDGNVIFLCGSAGGTFTPKGWDNKAGKQMEDSCGMASTYQERKGGRVAGVLRQRADQRKDESRCIGGNWRLALDLSVPLFSDFHSSLSVCP